MHKKRIAVDFDDVIFDFVGAFLMHHNQVFETQLTYDDVRTHHFHEVLGVTSKEAEKRIWDFVHSEKHEVTPAVADAPASLRILQKMYELHIVTSRIEPFVPQAQAWITMIVPETIHHFHFTNGYGDHHELTKRSKGEVCREIEAPILIEDMLSHAESASEHGVITLLLDKPWNRSHTPKGAVRRRTWKEIVDWLQHNY